MTEARSSEIEGLMGLLAEGRISRREFMKYGVGLGLSLGALGTLLRSASAGAAPLRMSSGEITCGVANAVGKFDPHTWGGFTSNIATNHIHQGLVRLNFGTSTVEPCLASSWEQPNPTTYIYHLRQGVTFHNGDPFTADDVVYSVLRAKKVSWGVYGLSNVKSVKARDQYTVEFTLTKPDWRFKWFEYWPPGAIVQGQLELNVMMPVIAHNVLFSMQILSNAVAALDSRCVKGITASETQAAYWVERSAALATALAPRIGYAKAAELAKESVKTGETIRELATRLKVLPPAELERVLDLGRMTEIGVPGDEGQGPA